MSLDIQGPSGLTTENSLLRWTSSGGKRLEETLITVDDSQNMAGIGTISAGAITSDTLIAGDGASTGVVKSNGNFDLDLQTGNATTSKITITDGANGDISMVVDGTGSLVVGSGAAAGVLKSSGNFDVTLQTGNATTSSLTIVDGANGNINAVTDGTGALVVGNGAAQGLVQSSGDFDLTLRTGNATTSSITIVDGANGNINAVTDGTGALVVGSGAASGTIQSSGDFDLTLQTGNATTGTITITDGANGAITFDPDGTGNVAVGSARGIVSSVANGFAPFIVSAAPDAVTDTAAVSVANYYSTLTTTGAAVPTLADGTIIGQLKKIQMIVDGPGDAVLTPANLNGGTTVTFADVGDTAELLWDGTGWQVLALYNIVDGATAPVLA